ncbi:hypothetical protein A2154_02370 [Candidatus Gottesmanbacteria bacterium RBG_16_43_7]|uniref:Uncharacterized protein n=1 Tax=Candidatus Gottesmanbacteria bacterium RBG_16_43_7 TaxID=1798373 RepID=A0A1F5Z875_9BACT|nr:MAG: hypothetical protein A2154_02370 [Candidatus Gottesmanbacteria bacterium RBG_16_43_7]
MLGISINSDPQNKILEEIEKGLITGSGDRKQGSENRRIFTTIFTPNPELLVFAAKHPWFAELFNQADITLPDGVWLVKGQRFLRKSPDPLIPQRIAGVDFMEELVKLSVKRGISVGLIGGKGQVAVKALECLVQKYPGLQGWAMEAPEIKFKTHTSKFTKKYIFNSLISDSGSIDSFIHQAVSRIIKHNTQTVFVGLGAPKQEIFINKLKIQISKLKTTTQNSKLKNNWLKQSEPDTNYQQPETKNALILMSVGGAFDYISGRLRRAPPWVRRAGFEWLWRLIAEPWRVKRQLALFEFLILTLRQKITGLK